MKIAKTIIVLFAAVCLGVLIAIVSCTSGSEDQQVQEEIDEQSEQMAMEDDVQQQEENYAEQEEADMQDDSYDLEENAQEAEEYVSTKLKWNGRIVASSRYLSAKEMEDVKDG